MHFRPLLIDDSSTCFFFIAVELNACVPNPCLFGNCINLSHTNMYTCDCSPHYYGRNCSLHTCDIHDYCQHGGLCSGNGLCQCTDGWAGPKCETQKCDIISVSSEPVGIAFPKYRNIICIISYQLSFSVREWWNVCRWEMLMSSRVCWK